MRNPVVPGPVPDAALRVNNRRDLAEIGEKPQPVWGPGSNLLQPCGAVANQVRHGNARHTLPPHSIERTNPTC